MPLTFFTDAIDGRHSVVFVVLFLTMTGCLNGTGGPVEGCPERGILKIHEVDSPPSNASIGEIRHPIESDSLRESLRTAKRTGNASVGPIPKSETQTIYQDLSHIEPYNGPGDFGQFARYNGSLLRVRLLCLG